MQIFLNNANIAQNVIFEMLLHKIWFWKCDFCQKWDSKNANFQEMKLWKCEFGEKWYFQNVNFLKYETLKMWILWKIRFSKCEFLDKLRNFCPSVPCFKFLFSLNFHAKTLKSTLGIEFDVFPLKMIRENAIKYQNSILITVERRESKAEFFPPTITDHWFCRFSSFPLAPYPSLLHA